MKAFLFSKLTLVLVSAFACAFAVKQLVPSPEQPAPLKKVPLILNSVAIDHSDQLPANDPDQLQAIAVDQDEHPSTTTIRASRRLKHVAPKSVVEINEQIASAIAHASNRSATVLMGAQLRTEEGTHDVQGDSTDHSLPQNTDNHGTGDTNPEGSLDLRSG